jgi:hypothetical protein
MSSLAAPFSSLLLMRIMSILPLLGINFLGTASADPATDAIRYQTVAKQIDQGGALYGYVSVDGDLTALIQYLDYFMFGMKEFDKSVPEFDAKSLLKISGLDSISALGLSSIRVENGFRNEVYLHTSGGRRGFLTLFGNESKPFEVLELAPSGTDLVFEQVINLKTFYNNVVMQTFGGGPLSGNMPPLGQQGMMMKMMANGFMKQPLQPGLSFTMEKLLADLDTKLTVIIDADPATMVNVPDTKGVKMPKLQGVAMLDGLGWVMNEWVEIVEPMIARDHDQLISRIKVFRNPTWIGIQTNYDSRFISRKDKKEFTDLGWDDAILAHHIPSGKLIATTSIEFGDQLFAPNNKLSQDPVFQKTMKDLPMKGTAISYVSPVFMIELRDVIHKVIDLENPEEKESKRDDRFGAYSMLDLFLPEGAVGEGMVATTKKEGLLTVSNSMYSHKSKILLGTAAPLMIGASVFTVVQSFKSRSVAESSSTKSTEDTKQEAENLKGLLKEK